MNKHTMTHGTHGRPMLLGVIGGLAYSLACALSFAPVSFWPAAFLALPAFMLLILRAGTARPLWTALSVGLGTVPLWIWTHGWIFGVAWPGAIGVVIYLAIYPAAFAWLLLVMVRRWGVVRAIIGSPFAWLGLEWIRSEVVWGGYAWYSPVQGLIAAPWLAWAAGVVGMHGVSLLLTLLSAGVVGLVWNFKRNQAHTKRWGGACLGIVLVWSGLSWLGSAPEPDGPTLRIAAVQTATSQSVRGIWATSDRLETMELLIDLSREAGATPPRPDVIVWPETMFPGDTLAPADIQAEREADLIWFERGDRKTSGYRRLVWRGRDGLEKPSAVTQMADAGERKIVPSLVCADTLLFWQEIIGVPMLIGTDGFEKLRIETDAKGVPQVEHEGRYNSVFLVTDGEVQPERYDKHHLTPFGEAMPGIEHWPALQNWLLNVGIGATGMRFDLSRGERGAGSTRFELMNAQGETVRVATPICFEATAPWRCRELVVLGGKRTADVLIGLTNDGWFGRWATGREAHLDLSRWRSVELWTPMIRSANTGISASIDVRGRVTDRLRSHEIGLVVADVRTVRRVSPYSRGGFVAAWIGPLGLAGLVLTLIVRGDLFQRSPAQMADNASDEAKSRGLRNLGSSDLESSNLDTGGQTTRR